MKVWFVAQSAEYAMDMGEYAPTSGPYRTRDQAIAAAKVWQGEGEIVVYEAVAVRILTMKIDRRVIETVA